MKFFQKVFIVKILLFVNLWGVSALSLQELFPLLKESELTTLQKEGVLRHSVARFSDLTCFPDVPAFRAHKEHLKTLQPKYNIEAAYYIPDAGSAPAQKIMNSLLQVSTMPGLEFYSRREKKVKVLVYEAYVIDKDAPDAAKQPDLTVKDVSQEVKFLLHQDEETFGKANYEVTLTYHPENYYTMRIVNLATLKKGIVTVAKPGEFDFLMALFPINNKDLVLYEINTSNQTLPSFLKKDADQSQYNRFDAFKHWLMGRYQAATAKSK